MNVVQYAYTAVAAALPFLIVRWRRALPAAAVVGFAVPSAMFLELPLNYVYRLATVINGLTGIPAALALFLFPVFYCVIMLSAAVMWSFAGEWTGRA
ncbi:MAG: hypothetical protein QXP70_04290 [Methanomassiliicoccales archaeon]